MLVSDRRGAIVVVAVFMSIFLVGCLWYLIGIGEAAVYRERLDAGADAATFTGAVYHARGMNMIAMLNLIIAASLAIVVIAKTLKFIIAIVYYAARFTCALAVNADPPEPDGGACATAADAGNKLILLSTVIDKVEANGDGLLASLSTAQREIAVVTPWVASTESTNAAAKYAPIVKGGAAVSMSMIPTATRLGLPVTDEPYEITCKRAGEIVPQLVAAMIPPAYLAYLTGDPIDIAGGFSPKYCGPGEFTGNDMDLFDEKDVCKKKEQEWKKDFKEANGRWPDPDKGEVFDKDKCVEENEVDDDEMDETMDDKGIPDVNPANDLDKPPEPEKKTAKMLCNGAVNGNDYFQVYSFIVGDTERLHKPDKGVQIAAGNQAQAITSDDLEKWGMAQAEFYYDQTPAAIGQDRCWKPPCGLKWPQYKENVLWNLRWRARLRFYRLPNDKAVDVNILAGGLPSTAPVGVDSNYIPAATGAINQAIGIGLPGQLLTTKINLSKAILNP